MIQSFIDWMWTGLLAMAVWAWRTSTRVKVIEQNIESAEENHDRLTDSVAKLGDENRVAHKRIYDKIDDLRNDIRKDIRMILGGNRTD